MNNITIIDPASPETNRGSYCYLSYILANFFKDHGNSVTLLEEFNISNSDAIDTRNHLYCALWSYPQIETCMMIHRMYKGVKFFGYYPLIKHLGLPIIELGKKVVLDGMRSYPKYYHHYKYQLLSDCDMHIKTEVDEKVFPMFTSYGCIQKCSFCSASKNTNHQRYILEIEEIEKMLIECQEQNIHAIHFTDEDFFFDTNRAIRILEIAHKISPKFKFIALGTVVSVHNLFKKVSKLGWIDNAPLQQLKLIEIGLESADKMMQAAMGKNNTRSETVAVLAKNLGIPILWLCVTFYPGESIASLNATGRFLEQYGLNPDKMLDRVVTNGTEGGLGQFYQKYHGCDEDATPIKFTGLVLTERPMRLVPSYIPETFWKDDFEVQIPVYESKYEKFVFWCDKYNVETPSLNSMRIYSARIPSQLKPVGWITLAIQLAIAARLNIITPRKEIV